MVVALKQVKDTFAKFEERLWNLFRKYHTLGQQNPGLLVACVRVVELQEVVDKQLQIPKMWKRQAMKCMEDSVTAKFNLIAYKWNELESFDFDAVDEDTGEPPLVPDTFVSGMLEDATALSHELAQIYDYVEPCFPPSFKMFPTLWSRYHLQFASMLDSLGLKANNISNRDILSIVTWIEDYLETLRGLGIEEEELQMPKHPVLLKSSGDVAEESGLKLLMKKYMERVKESTTSWYMNIIESDLKSEPKVSEEGILWSPGVVDFFRMLNDSLATVEGVTQGEMMFLSAMQSLAMMHEFVKAQVTQDVISMWSCG